VIACGDDDEGGTDDFAPAFAYLRLDGDAVVATLSDGEQDVSYEVPNDLEPLIAFACDSEGQLVLPVGGRDDGLLSPLLLEDGELILARELPPAIEPAWIGDGSLLLRVVDPDEGQGVRVYRRDNDTFTPETPLMPGRNAGWVSGPGLIAVQAGPGGGFDRLGIYGLAIEEARAGRVEATAWQLISSVPIDPRQLNPDGDVFVFATAAQENQQRDIQAINADGSDARTLVATPLEEFAPAWTADGRILFLRRELLGEGQDGAEAKVEVISIDLGSGEERILAEDDGIFALAVCSPGD
jgi:hypothetical protein